MSSDCGDELVAQCQRIADHLSRALAGAMRTGAAGVGALTVLAASEAAGAARPVWGQSNYALWLAPDGHSFCGHLPQEWDVVDAFRPAFPTEWVSSVDVELRSELSTPGCLLATLCGVDLEGRDWLSFFGGRAEKPAAILYSAVPGVLHLTFHLRDAQLASQIAGSSLERILVSGALLPLSVRDALTREVSSLAIEGAGAEK